MFKALKQIIAETLGDSKKTPKFLVTKKKEIIALLKQAHKKKAFLTVQIPDQDESYTTALLGIYPDHDLVVLDEFSPSVGHKRFLQQKEAKVTGRVNGVELRFKTRLVGVGSKSDVSFYKVAMPTVMYFCQQRQSYRVSLKGASIPFFSPGSGLIPSVRGYLLDLSAGGVGVILDHKVSLSRGDTLEVCIVTLPKRGDIQFTLQVDAVRDNASGGGMNFGGHFCKLSEAEQAVLQKYIAESQRKQANKSR